MAKVKWKQVARTRFMQAIEYGAINFGTTAVNRMCNEVDAVAKRIANYPKAGTPEPLLKDLPVVLRSCHIRKRFKLIYYYDEATDTAFIADFWDTRMSPENIIERFTL